MKKLKILVSVVAYSFSLMAQEGQQGGFEHLGAVNPAGQNAQQTGPYRYVCILKVTNKRGEVSEFSHTGLLNVSCLNIKNKLMSDPDVLRFYHGGTEASVQKAEGTQVPEEATRLNCMKEEFKDLCF